jgi:uncharacterized protein (TIGR03118 family)
MKTIVGIAGLWFVASMASVMGCSAPASDTSDGVTSDELRRSKSGLAVRQTNLVADVAGGAATTDANLLNPWGLAFNPAGGPAWIANNHSGTSTSYDAAGALKLTVAVPGPTGSAPPSSPTGQVFNGTSEFDGDVFIFVTEDGALSGWKPGSGVALRASIDATYKGLAISRTAGHRRLFAANFKSGAVDVFDGAYQTITTKGGFVDKSIPANYAPFNVQELGGQIYVAYAETANHADEDAGPGKGFVDAFDTEGRLLRRLISRGALNAPWGLAIAPASFGKIAGSLLVGNFGDGKINVYDVQAGDGTCASDGYSPPVSGYKGALTNSNGAPLVIDGLWALSVGGGAGASHVYFTAGPNEEAHGLYGRLDPK